MIQLFMMFNQQIKKGFEVENKETFVASIKKNNQNLSKGIRAPCKKSIIAMSSVVFIALITGLSFKYKIKLVEFAKKKMPVSKKSTKNLKSSKGSSKIILLFVVLLLASSSVYYYQEDLQA